MCQFSPGEVPSVNMRHILTWRKLDRYLLNFIAIHFSPLVFLKHPVWNVNVASSWTRHMNHSPPATVRENVRSLCRQLLIHFLLKLHDVFCCDRQSLVMSLWLFFLSLLLWLHPTTCFPVFIQFLWLMEPGRALETDFSHLLRILLCKMMCLCQYVPQFRLNLKLCI